MTRTYLAVIAALFASASPAWAQYENGGSAGSSPPSAVAAPAKTNSFENLPAGDRKIARALFMAQRPTMNGPAPLSLNQIADLKARSSWPKVFSQMQAGGLIQAKTLGQVVGGYERQRRSDVHSSDGAGRGTTLVTSGSGSVVASSRRAGAGMAHGGDATGETHTEADIAAADRPVRDRPQHRDR